MNIRPNHALFLPAIFTLTISFHLMAKDIPSEINIWPGAAPGSESVQIELNIDERDSNDAYRNRALSQIRIPRLEILIPEHPNGTSVIICPGGGYRYLSYDKEGVDMGKRLNQDGITAFVLSYRLPAEGHDHGPWVPLQDAQRALRLVRSHASEWNLDPDKIGIMGFSAGGHLASTLGTHYATECYPPVDAIDEVYARPNFMILIYPVVSMDAQVTHMGSRTKLLGETPDDSAIKEFSNELHVDEHTPPAFFALASDDGAVPPANSLQFIQEMLKAGVPVEFHSFISGGHGFGMRLKNSPTESWPDLLSTWLKDRGF